MPDLPDELRAVLHARAEDAPAVPAPNDRLVRSVRRRQAVRTSLAVGGATLGVVAVVAVAVAAVRPGTTGSPPAANPTAPLDDKYEFCPGSATRGVDVAVHATELKFQYGCYRVVAGATQITFDNGQATPHNLVIAREGGAAVFTTETVENGSFVGRLPQPLAAGDYTLTCNLHPEMHAQLLVR